MKLAVIGKGTVGSLAILHFLTYTDWDIDWVSDPNTPTTAVGEGTTIRVPSALANSILKFSHDDLIAMNGTPKVGIWKENWGGGKKYLHPFPIDLSGLHFNAIEFQNKVFEMLQGNQRITMVNERVTDPQSYSADYVMVCSGSPKDLDEYNILDSIVVNSAYVTQCFWDAPTFNYTLTLARPWGWVFGIPLQNRCSIGYVYNSDFVSLDEIKEDVKNVFEQYNLTPSDTTNHLEFKNYVRKNNFTSKVVYNGNASFFLEPLEATSTTTADDVSRFAYDMWKGNISVDEANRKHLRNIEEVLDMIALHYCNNIVYRNDFWDNAIRISCNRIKNSLDTNSDFQDLIHNSIQGTENMLSVLGLSDPVHYGTWSWKSWNINVKNLQIKRTLKYLMGEK